MTAGRGSLNTQTGSAKFIETSLKTDIGFPSKYLMISIPTAPTTMAVVVAMAGIIFPAITFTLKLSTSSIL